jgi:hypothetical protein
MARLASRDIARIFQPPRIRRNRLVHAAELEQGVAAADERIAVVRCDRQGALVALQRFRKAVEPEQRVPLSDVWLGVGRRARHRQLITFERIRRAIERKETVAATDTRLRKIRLQSNRAIIRCQRPIEVLQRAGGNAETKPSLDKIRVQGNRPLIGHRCLLMALELAQRLALVGMGEKVAWSREMALSRSLLRIENHPDPSARCRGCSRIG